jgi:hypothetical protein
MFWTPDGESYMPGLEFFSKKPCAIGEISFFTCFGAVLYEGSMEEFE